MFARLPNQSPLLTMLKLRDLKVIMNNETLMKAWNDNMYQFVCRCAEAAKKGKFVYFGVQNCGKLICGKLILVGGAVNSQLMLSLSRRASHKGIFVFNCYFL